MTSGRLAGPPVLLEIRGGGEANVLDGDAMARLEVGLLAAERGGAAGVVLHGPAGRFAAGADLRALAKLDGPGAHEFARCGARLFRRLRETPLWLVAAVGGHCIGGALDLALACDSIVASPRAFFRHPGARFGFPTTYGGNRMLPPRVGAARAAAWLLEGRALTSAEAHAAGLVAAIATEEDLLDRALALAAGWSAAAPPPLGRALQQVLRGAGRLPLAAAVESERAAFAWVHAALEGASRAAR